MRPVDKVTVHVLVDNNTDMLSSRPPYVMSERRVLVEAGMMEVTGEALCSAHHGLSLLITVETGGKAHSVLFDGGPDGYAMLRNGTRMGIDFSSIEAMVLSHGHYDHFQGIPQAIDLIHQAQVSGESVVPLYAHPDVFHRHGSRQRNGNVIAMPEIPTIEDFGRLGVEVLTSTQPQEILDGMVYISGEIPRESFEPGFPGHVQQDSNGVWQDDIYVMDERFLAVHVKDKGVMVFTGCSHAGVVNILNHAKAVFAPTPIYGILGGLHLVAPNEALIPQTIDAMRDHELRVIIAGHCTGWRGLHALLNAFGEDVVDPLAVGTRITL